MQRALGLGCGRWVTSLLALLLSCLPITTGSASAPAAMQPDAASPALDLAAMTLTPADLDEAGLPGFGFDFGSVAFPSDLAAFIAESRGLSDEEARALVEDSGYRRWYESYLYLPRDPNDPRGVLSSAISSYILEFSEPAGAAAAWSWMEDESGDPTAEDVPLTVTLGEQAEATRYSGTDDATGQTYRALDLTVRTGNLHVGVRVLVWLDVEPELGTAVALVQRLLDRVAATVPPTSPGLGSQALRLSGDDVQPSIDGYVLLDGKATKLLGESDADAKDREASAATNAVTDEYRVWQSVASGGAQPERTVWYFLEIERFSDDSTAAAWLEGQTERLSASSAYTNVQVDSSAPTFGDQSIVYSSEAVEFPVAYRSVALRVGSTVAVIDVEGPGIPPTDTVVALGEAQAGCLAAGACVDPLPVPSSLSGYIAGVKPTLGAATGTPTAEGTPVSEATPQPVGTPVGQGAFVSERYGYTLTYDPSVWQLFPVRAEAPTEWIELDSDSGTVNIVGRPRSLAGDLETCVKSYLLDYGWDNGAWEATLIQPLLVESDRVAGAYSLADQIFGGTAYISVECRTIGGDNTLLIANFAFTDAGEMVPVEEVASFEELMAGLQVTGESPATPVPPATPAALGEYHSPTWGFTVKWDPADWVVADASRDDGLQLQLNGSVLVMAKVDAVEAYGGDPQACLKALAESDTDSSLVPSTRYAAPKTVESAVGGVYELGDFGVMYFECRTLVPGQSVLQIRFGAPNVDYTAALPALEDLLANIAVGED